MVVNTPVFIFTLYMLYVYKMLFPHEWVERDKKQLLIYLVVCYLSTYFLSFANIIYPPLFIHPYNKFSDMAAYQILFWCIMSLWLSWKGQDVNDRELTRMINGQYLICFFPARKLCVIVFFK